MANGDGTFRILNKFSNKVLDVQNSSVAEGAAVQQWAWSSLDVSALKSGLYVVRISSAGYNFEFKIDKQ